MSDSHMGREAREAPVVLRTQAARWQTEAGAVRGAVAARPTAVLVGRGTSGNACTFAAYLFGLKTGRQPIEFRPWLTTQSLPEADWSDAVVYAFSFSGKSTDIAASAAWLRERGAKVVAVSEGAGEEAHLIREADHHVRLGCGPEYAVPATKSFVAQLFVAAALAGYDIEAAAAQTAACMEEIAAAGLPSIVADFVQGARTVTWIARGPSYAGALDAALKLQESVGVPAFGYSTAEFLHGPIAASSKADRVVLFSGTNEPTESKHAVAAALVAREVPVLTLGTDQRPDAALPVPVPDERWARTAVLAYLAQLTCVELAGRYGVDPDAPATLRKVTRTR